MESSDLREIAEQFPDYVDQVNRNYVRNFIWVLLDSSFFSFALAILSVDTILPYFISHLTDQRVWIGVVSALYFWGFYFPQLVGAYLVHDKPLRKWSIFWISIAERAGILMIAVLVQVYHLLDKTETLVLFLIAFSVFAITNGLIGPAYADFISKNINRNRGTFYGATNAVGGLIGFGASLLAQFLLNKYEFPINVQILFWVAFASSFISPILILQFREIPYPVVRQAESLTQFVRNIPSSLTNYPVFSKYLVTRSVIGLGWMANSFYAIYAVRQYNLSEGNLGIITMIILLSQSLLSFVWGQIGDRFGFKLVYILSTGLIAGQTLLALFAWGPWAFYAVAFCMGAGYAAVRASDATIIFEIAPPSETSRFIGIANTLLSPIFAVAPLFGGLIVDYLSYPVLFITNLAVAIIASLVTIFWLPNPRLVSRAGSA